MSWCFWLGAFYMFLLTNWFYEKEYITVIARLIPEIMLTQLLPKIIIIILSIFMLFLNTVFEFTQKTQFLLGMIFMFLADTIIFNDFFTKDVRNHVAKYSAKNFMKAQHIAVIIITTIFVFVLK